MYLQNFLMYEPKVKQAVSKVVLVELRKSRTDSETPNV